MMIDMINMARVENSSRFSPEVFFSNIQNLTHEWYFVSHWTYRFCSISRPVNMPFFKDRRLFPARSLKMQQNLLFSVKQMLHKNSFVAGSRKVCNCIYSEIVREYPL